MDSSGWGALATAAGSSVSAVTLIFIAFQTKATRSAAESTRDQAEIAAKALGVAERDHVQSQFLAIEAVKARIDAQMPRILLSVDDLVQWPPMVPSTYHLGSPQIHKRTEPFRLPRDANERLILRVPVLLRNESDNTVEIQLSEPLFYYNDEEQRVPLPTTVQLNAGQGRGDLYLDVERSVAEWIQIYHQRRDTGIGDEYEFIATYISPLDTGAIDRHRIAVGGTVLEPVPNEDGAWRLIGDPNPNSIMGSIGAIGCRTQPTTRTYYLSRTRGIELDPVDLTTP